MTHLYVGGNVTDEMLDVVASDLVECSKCGSIVEPADGSLVCCDGKDHTP